MTVSANSRRREYEGNGVTTVFSGPMAFESSDIEVYLYTDGEPETVPPGSYDVERLGIASGTRITMRDAPPLGSELVILRVVEFSQKVNITNQGAFHADTIEKGFDALAMQIQQLDEGLKRSIRLPDYFIGDARLDRIMPLMPLVGSADGRGFEFGDTALTGDMLLRPNIEDGTDNLFRQVEAGSVSRALVHKLRESASPEDFGALGDGVTDDTASISATLARGGSLVLRPGAVYSVSPPLTIPPGTNIRTNGAILKVRGTTGEPAVYVSDDVSVDNLRIEVPAGVQTRGVYVLGRHNVEIGALSVIAVEQQGPSPVALQALAIEESTSVRIGQVTAVNYDRPIRIDNCQDVNIGGLYLTNYIRGVYIESCAGVYIGKSRITGASPDAAYAPGNNAIIMQSVDGECSDIVIEDAYISNSGEHGIRVGGGDFSVRNVRLVRTVTSLTGASAIKIQGVADHAPEPFEYSENIKIIDPIIEDCGPADYSSISQSLDNYSAIICKYTKGLTISNPIIRKKLHDFSCKGGIYLQAVVDANITSPMIRDAKFDGVFVSLNSTGPVDVQDVLIEGGQLMFNGRHGIAIEYPSSTLRRFVVNGVKASNNTGYGIAIQQDTFAGASGSGSLNTVIFDGVVEGNTAGGVSSDSSTILLSMQGQFNAAIARNGSTWVDRVGGFFKVLKSGSWTNI